MPCVERDRSQADFAQVLKGFPVAACLGLACLRLFAGSMSGSHFGAAWWVTLVQAAALFSIVVIDRVFTYDLKDVKIFVAVGSSVMAAGGYFSAGFTEACFQIAGGVLRGVGSAMLIASFGFYLCSVRLRYSVVCIVAAFAIYGIALRFVPVAAGDPFVAVLFAFASGVCLLRGFTSDSFAPRFGGECLRSALGAMAKTASYYPVFLLVFFYMALLALLPRSDSTDSIALIWPAIYLFELVIVLLWTVVLKRDNIDELLPVLVLVLLAGPLGYLSFDSLLPDASLCFMEAMGKNNMLIVWVLLVAAAHRSNANAVPFFCFGHIVCLQVPLIIGKILSPVIGLEAQALFVLDAVVILIVMAFLAVGVFFLCSSLFRRQRLVNSDFDTPDALFRDNTNMSLAAAVFVSRFGITQREVDVVGLIGKGYTMGQIAERLVISEETVRSHAKNIYRKTGAHGKKELVEMIEEIEAGGAKV